MRQSGNQRREQVRYRCGGTEAVVSRVTGLPLIPVIFDDRVRLRIDRCPRLELEVPLRAHQGLMLAAQLLGLALAADHSTASADRHVLEAQAQDRVAGVRAKHSHVANMWMGEALLNNGGEDQ
jgi:hypothetical protein